jgi:hypothetical protein
MMRIILAALAATVATPSLAWPDVTAFGLTETGQILRFAIPQKGRGKLIKVRGLDRGERLVGIDMRPSNRMLYAVTDRSRMFTIDPDTGVATAVGPLTQTLTPGTTGVDFNPVPDRLRIVNDAEQNLRANPADGVSVNDKPLAYAKADVAAGNNPSIAAAAYTNNVAGTKTTTLYVIDAARGTLATQAPPNDGVLNTVGTLGVRTGLQAGFDIVTDAAGTNHAYAVMTIGRARQSRLYRIDLASGAAIDLGRITSPAPLIGLALMLP